MLKESRAARVFGLSLAVSHGKGQLMRSRIHAASIVRLGVLGLALVVLAGTSGPAARAATLRWKFKPGETLHYVMDQRSMTLATLPGGEQMRTTLSQMIEMTWTVKSVDPSGQAELTQTITRIRDQLEGLVGSYTYDSKEGGEPSSLIAAPKIPVFKALLGAEIPFKMNARGETTDVRMPEALVKTLGELGPAAGAAGVLFTEEGMKEMISRSGLVLPEEDLRPGKTWTQQNRNASPAGTLVMTSTYRYEGPAPNDGPDTARITLQVNAEIQPAEADAKENTGGLKIRSQKSEGTYLFDNAAGRVLRSTLKESIEVAASVKVGLGALAKEMEIIQSNESTTTRKLVK
jgi:hypothetical protein